MPTRREADPAPLRTDVLIVGSGLAGQTLAAALGSAGVDCVIMDRADPAALADPARDGRTTAIAYGSRQVLAGIGVWPAMAGAAAPIREIRVADSRLSTGASSLFLHYGAAELCGYVDNAPEALGWIVENHVIRRSLFDFLAALPNVRLLAPAALAALERGVDDVTARLADGRVLRARLAVGADGRTSTLRREAGIRSAEWRYPQTAIVCNVNHALPHGDVAVENFHPGGPFAILPLRDGAGGRHRSSIVWTEDEALAPSLLALPEAAFLQELARRFGDHLGALGLDSARWSHPVGLLHAERYVDRRLALIGDAAHVIHPIAGQGLNLGIRDVAALAEAVVDTARLGLDIGGAAPLARYQRWRRVDNLTLAAVTDGLNRLFSNDIAPLRLARDVGLAAVGRVAPLKRVFMRHAMGVVGTLPRLVKGEAL